MTNPIFINPESKKEYTCIGFACDALRSGWEWFAFEKDKEDPNIFFGLVHGFETEFGYFSKAELQENKIPFYENPKDLQGIMPPVGWTKKA
jgi:hypothetical protein